MSREGNYLSFIKNSILSDNSINDIDIGNMPKLYLKCNKVGEKYYVPLIGHSLMLKSLSISNTVYFPLKVTKSSWHQRGWAGAVSFLKNIYIDSSITAAKLKEDTYYTGSGIILKDDFTPLIVVYGIYTDNFRAYPKKLDVYVNTCVYSDDTILSKNIKNTCLSTLSTEPVRVYDWQRSEYIYPKTRIILTNDFSDMLVKPTVPDINFNDISVNRLLAENVTDVINCVL